MKIKLENPVRDSFKVAGNAMNEVKPKARKAPVKRKTELKKFKPDIRVWKKCLELAKGDVKRIDIISETEAIVRNHG